MRGHAPVALVDHAHVILTEGRYPEHDPILARGPPLLAFLLLRLLLGVLTLLFLGGRLHLQEGQPGAVRPPEHRAAVGFLLLACHPRGGRSPADSGVEFGLVELGEHGAFAVPDLLHAAKAVDRDDIAEGRAHRRDARMLTVRREIEAADHGGLTDPGHPPVAHRDRGELPGHMPLEQLLVERGAHQARVGAEPVLSVLGQLDLRSGRDRQLHWAGRAILGDQDGRDLLPVRGPLEGGDHRGEHGFAGHAPGVPVLGVGHVDMRLGVVVGVEGKLRAVGRPAGVGDARVPGHLDVGDGTIGGRD